MRLRVVLAATLAAGCVAQAPAPVALTFPPTTPSTAAPPGWSAPPATEAAGALAALRVEPEVDPGAYDRKTFRFPSGGKDSRGCSTRARVLQRDSEVPAQVAYPGCKVLAGRWTDAYTGTVFDDPGKVSIDHLVPLKEAYTSGASSFSKDQLVAFANDVDSLSALKVIGGSGNASKGHKDPAEWKPPLRSAWAAYAREWVTVKVAYGLTADQREIDALEEMLTVHHRAP
ncbi:MAG: hypothetical protein WKF86_02470 [Acidimicrobiales bacterium]